MKKRILAAILAVSMFATLAVGLVANAEVSVDFSVKEWWGAAGTTEIAEVEGMTGETTKAWKVTNTGWGVGNMGNVLTGLDKTKEYTLSAKVAYDWAYIRLQDPSVMVDNPEKPGEKIEETYVTFSTLNNGWKEIEETFTGHETAHIVFQMQSGDGYNSGVGYIDDIVLKEGDTVIWSEDYEDTVIAPSQEAPQVSKAPSTFAGYKEDFEGETNTFEVKEWWGTAGTYEIEEVVGHDGNNTKAFKYVNDAWGTIVINPFVTGLDADTEYVFSCWIKGDVSNMTFPFNTFATADTLSAEWKQITYTFDGYSSIDLKSQVQSTDGYNGGIAYIDDVEIYEKGQEPVVESAAPSTEPVVESAAPSTEPVVESAAPSTEPVVESAAPSAEPSQEVVAPKVKVKFNKAKVSIKKGKKVTLTVKVTGKKVKKATFKLSKKKIVKITKKGLKVTVKALKKGKVTLSAKAAGKTAKCKITVKK